MRSAWVLIGLLALTACARAGERLEHKGDVLGEGPEWDKRYAAEALGIFKGLKPDPEWVAKLKALPENTWLKCNPAGDQKPERGRAEVPMVYAASVEACMFCCGCTSPGYSSDTWLYHTGANRWVQMWPNYVKYKGDNKEPRPSGRPYTRCSLGLAYDADRKMVVLHGGANGNDYRTWAWDPATNKWKVEAGPETGYRFTGGNCLGFVPGFGVVEVGGAKNTEASTWVFGPAAGKWRKLTTRGAPPGGYNSRLLWAAGSKRLIYWAHTADALWAFDPATGAWEDISPRGGERPAGFYRQGMAYDSANDVVVMFGRKDEGKKLGYGPWIYSFAAKSWTNMKPGKGPPRGHGQQMLTCYDPEYNVVVIACSGRGTWVYRYRRAPEKQPGGLVKPPARR